MHYPAWLARCALAFLAAATAGAAEYEKRAVTFKRPDGDYAPEAIARDFGNGTAPETRRFARINDEVLQVTFTAGKKVDGTGLGLQVKVPEAEAYELRYRIRYPGDFETGLHGKQFGMSGGKGYDGGRGEQARANGDGWSARVQFDALPEGVRQSLYVYHADMAGKYGEGLRAGSFVISRGKWHEIRLRVTVPSKIGASDGRIEVWGDGEKRIDAQGLRLVAKEEGRSVNRVRAELFPGGGGVFPAKDEIVEVDDFGWQALKPAR